MNFLFSTELKPAELEDRFRQYILAHDRRQVFIIIVLSLFIILGFIVLDFNYIHNRSILIITIVARAATAIIFILGAGVIRLLSSYKNFDRVIFILILTMVSHLLIVSAVRPGDEILIVVWDIFALFAIYTAVPIPLQFQTLSALYLTIGSVTLWLAYKHQSWKSFDTSSVLAAYFFSNIYGFFLSGRFQRSQRQQFVLLQQETEAKKELADHRKELENALSEKSAAFDKINLLMKEMNHRVKNNLNIIQSLLNLQSYQTGDEHSRTVLIESAGRVKSISNIHHMLTQKVDLKNVDVSSFIQELVRDLKEGMNIDKSHIEIQFELDPIQLDMDILIPFALILNEMITNAFKYAFTDRKNGELQVALHALENDNIELIVKDNGKGLPQGFSLDETESLGMKIVQSLVDQIDGKVEYKTEHQKGTEFKILFNPKKLK